MPVIDEGDEMYLRHLMAALNGAKDTHHRLVLLRRHRVQGGDRSGCPIAPLAGVIRKPRIAYNRFVSGRNVESVAYSLGEAKNALPRN